jgi:hypothetical protein
MAESAGKSLAKGGKMTVFRIDVHRKSGEVMLWMETPCGPKPIIGWADLQGVREFSGMLLDFYEARMEEKDKIKETSDSLLRQALGDEQHSREGGFFNM